jgi:hypothetical protein
VLTRVTTLACTTRSGLASARRRQDTARTCVNVVTTRKLFDTLGHVSQPVNLDAQNMDEQKISIYRCGTVDVTLPAQCTTQLQDTLGRTPLGQAHNKQAPEPAAAPAAAAGAAR